jgi:signal transduction histidine kinase/ligand-binding sensor domain-containing protein
MLSLTRFLACLVLLTASLSPAFALEPGIDPAGYRHDRWSEVDGHPNFIDALAQTEDGWLWVASRHNGLFRFDGVRFIPYATRDGSRLQNVGISVLRPGPDNTLWIGHGRGGVSVLQNHRLQHILTPDQTGSVFTITHDADGGTWIASNRGLYEIRKGVPERLDQKRGYGGARSEYVMADSQGRVWAADGVSLFRLERGARVFQRVRAVENDPMMIESPDGSVWLVLGKRFERLSAPAERWAGARTVRGNTYQSAFDRNGNLWSGNCPVGVCVLRPDAWQNTQGFDAMSSREQLAGKEQLTGMTILSLLEDREGNVWIGTTGGLDRLRDQPVHMVKELFDLGAVQAQPHPGSDTLVLATQRLNGELTLWSMSGGRLVSLPNPLNARKIARAPDGSVVLAGSGGIERRYADRSVAIPLPPVSLAPGNTIRFRVLAAGNEDVWAELTGYGTWHFQDGQWTRLAAAAATAEAMAIDKAGRTYISYGANRLHLTGGGTETDIQAAAGVDVGEIRFIHTDGEVIVSGTRGNGIVRNGHIESIQFSLADGVGAISGIANGPDGTYWVNASRGLLRIRADDWQRTMRDPRIPLRGELFDALDGYTGGGETIWLTDTLFFSPDGKLWAAGERGLGWLDPASLKQNPVSANVEILELTSSGRRFSPHAPIELGTGQQDVQIAYAAPSLRMPQRVRFRYRMLGLDDKWEEAGARRTAYYSKLAPGSYTFEILALNESGLPSTEISRLHFEIAPRLTQTWWFYSICAVLAASLLFSIYRLRMRHLAARLEERFNIRASERESVARALHDTFLQSLQGLLFSMQAVVTKLPPDTAPRREFESLLERARTVLVEGRDEVQGLRSEFGSGTAFWEALMRDVDMIAANGHERVRLKGAAEVERLHRRLHHNVYAIVREAVFNALRHTDGLVSVHVATNAKHFVLSVTDHGNGLGIFRNGKPGHFGLPGMAEHAAQIGAKLQLIDGDGRGTKVVLLIPVALAFAEADKPATRNITLRTSSPPAHSNSPH